jgi:hypothetical protein
MKFSNVICGLLVCLPSFALADISAPLSAVLVCESLGMDDGSDIIMLDSDTPTIRAPVINLNSYDYPNLVHESMITIDGRVYAAKSVAEIKENGSSFKASGTIGKVTYVISGEIPPLANEEENLAVAREFHPKIEISVDGEKQPAFSGHCGYRRNTAAK